jgi:cell shape-determining protein MreC
MIFAPHFFSSLFTTIARPFWRVEFSIVSGSLKSPERLLAENEDLRNQLAELKLASDFVATTELENTELKALLGRNGSASTTVQSPARTTMGDVLAAVLKRPPVSPYDELIIDIGEDMQVSTSSLVYTVGNVVIGRVIDVLSNTSKVKLYSSPGEKLNVLIGTSHTPVAATGRGGGHYEGQVSRESGVREGDVVMSSQLNDRPLAVVTNVFSDPAETFETILFASPVNVYQLKWVVVRVK